MMTTKKTETKSQIMDRIADEHGCEIQPGANRARVLAVLPRYQQGFPRDGQRIGRCLAAMRAAGIDTSAILR